MRKRFLSILMAFVLCVSLAVPVAAAETGVVTQERVYQLLIGMKGQYPEGMTWTNDNYYNHGWGCAGFAYLLSDAAFGTLPIRYVEENVRLSDVRVGDILRINSDTHSVVVLEVLPDGVVVTEGNYAGTIHWGRKLGAAVVEAADYLITRYPEGTASDTFTDVPAGSWYDEPVYWAVQREITEGYGDGRFDPDAPCTQAQIITFIHRNAGKLMAVVEVDGQKKVLTDADVPIKAQSYYQKAINWAYASGIIDASFNPDAPCTRADAVRYIWLWKDSPAAGAGSFADVPASAPYAQAAAWAVSLGVTNGYGNGEFRPNNVCSRAEIATFLFRAAVPVARVS